ncbi:hypothetical protein PHLGIDRAFT_13329 [Phlebiopsis gigantea 11061_1 CR5-6]|uniref:Uncharacterized protein n=1 Tax=Phlebiopsis gigantea (strain 11061_1 CR5-6) TaxID=745531 RepID=A0A0C3RYP8_PHLG1|nr:hypothetical protein PHLGIDRAFT_13329 [Phlebiopsis gigantea 11061_1 CR5-6]
MPRTTGAVRAPKHGQLQAPERAHRATCRHASTLASLPASSNVKTIFTALIALGVGSTAYGLYEFYSMFTVWPKEVRGDLRAGIKAKNQGDLGMSEQFLNRALETARALPLEVLGSEPYLKLSGIAIALAGVLEDGNKPQEAYALYSKTFEELRRTTGLSGKERVRTVALAHKLAEMAETYQQPAVEEERWRVNAVEELLRVLSDEQSAARLRTGETDAVKEHQLVLSELELPPWVDLTDIVAPLQSLGAFYNKTGKQECVDRVLLPSS